MLTNTRLGFGMMRLPKNEQGEILLDQVQPMVDAYMASGMNYFDTAYVYEGSEEAVRKTLVEKYPRDAYTLADKLPGWKLTCEADNEKIFNESLELCGVDYFDFYLLHSIEEGHYSKYVDFKCFEFVQKMKDEGKIKHVGFSFHGSPELLEQVLTEHPEIEFVQLQLNYLDWKNDVIQSAKNYEIVRRHNKPIVVMEPIKGGTLAGFSQDINKIYTDYNPNASIASWALRFIGSLDGVMTILSGMSTFDQMEDNIQTMSRFKPINEQEKALIEEVTHKVLSAPTIPCTKCRYCVEGCPMNIEIPELFTAYNSKLLYGNSGRYKTYYKNHSSGDKSPASACISCGQCEGVCPQHLSIIDYLQDVSNMFDE